MENEGERGFIAAMHRLYSWSAIILVPLMTLIIAADTGLRYLAAMPLVWVQDVSGLILLLVFACGLPYSWPGGFHVRMDMLYNRFGAAGRRAVDAITAVAAFVIGVMLAHQGVLQAMRAFANGETTPGSKVVIWPFAAILALCAGLFCVVMLVRLAATFRARATGER